MNKCLIILLLILSILTITILGKKKKKNVDKRPTSITPELFCNACQAIVEETLKRVRHSKKESDIISALDDLCNMKNFFVYEYPPPEMRKGCEAFYAAHYDVLERELIKRIDNDSIEERICVKVTKACKGVDFEAKRQENLKKQKEQVDKRAKEDQQRQEEEEKQKEKQKQEQAEEVDLDLQQEDL